MDKEIYNHRGAVVGWIVGESDIFSRANLYIGFLEETNVFNAGGFYVGEFEDGFFWDRNGRAVAFIDGATNGPIIPITQIAPISPIHGITPIRPITPVTPVSPVHSLSWSQSAFEAFIRGQ